jgi:hypothetical protein
MTPGLANFAVNPCVRIGAQTGVNTVDVLFMFWI